MRLLFFLSIICIAMPGFAQQAYRCEYNQIARFKLPDSSIKRIRTQFIETGLGETMADQFAAQIADEGIEKEFLVSVNASPDTSFIEVEPAVNDGNISVNRVDMKTMMTKGKVYQYDISSNRWVDMTGNRMVGKFSKTSNTKKIFNYDCIEYVNADSTYRIWAAPTLPSYINPGIHIGLIPGAVLAYQFWQKDQFIRTEISKLDH